jgi:hypothetical protein
MKTLSLIECKCCNGTFLSDSQPVIINPAEEIAVIVRKVSYCSSCKAHEGRTKSSTYKKKI